MVEVRGIGRSRILGREIGRGALGLWRARRRRALTVVVLGIALATNGVLFGLLSHLFLSTPPLVRQPHSVFRVQRVLTIPGRGNVVSDVLSYPQYEAIAAHTPGVTSAAGSHVTSVSVGEGAESHRVTAAFVTESYFRFVGVAPEIGRTFSGDESAPPFGLAVVVLGHDLWVRSFGASREILGRTLRVGRGEYTIIGVLPANFRGVDRNPVELWLPLSVAGAMVYGNAWDFNAGAFWINAFVRIPPGTGSVAVASRIGLSLAQPSAEKPAGDQVILGPLNGATGAQSALQDRIALWLGGLAFAVLMVACANIGNSFLAIGIERRTDTAVRMALGGSRRLLGANVLGESMALSAGGGVLGLFLAVLVSRLVAAPLKSAGFDQAVQIDATLLMAMLGLVFVVGIVTAIAPLVALRERNLQPLLRMAGTADRGHERARLALLAGQVALTTALVAGAGLFVQSFGAIRAINPGFEPDSVIVADLDPLRETTPKHVEAEYFAMQRRLQGDPSVSGTAIAVTAPFLSGAAVRIVAPGVDSSLSNPAGVVSINGVTPGFFDVLRLRLLAGRTFNASDGKSAPVAVVTKHFAASIWGNIDPLHRCFHIFDVSSPCVEVIGVIADPERDKLGEAPESQFFVPLEQTPRLFTTRLLFVRSKQHPASAVEDLVKLIQRSLPNSPYPQVERLSELVGSQRRPWAWGATILVFFSGLAVLIACLGLHSALTREVKAREKDLAIRVALGAVGGRLVAVVLRRTGIAVVSGLGVGLCVSWLLGLRLQPVLFHTAAVTPGLDAMIVLTTAVMFLMATCAPVIRAARTDIATVLRGS